MWFRDPVSVSCLQRAIEVAKNTGFLEPLGAIGTVEAREAIVALTTHPLDYIAQAAKTALAKFRLK
jgi:hypothetical protein